MSNLFSTREDQSKTGPETIFGQIQCTPLVDVLSISIGSRLDNVDESTLFEIYGKVRVLDTRHGCENELFSFFNKDEDNPESVHFNEPLLLTTPSPTPIIRPSKNICLDVHLFDKGANNMVVAKGRIILDKGDEKCEEFFGNSEIDNQEEDSMIFAHVHYAIIQYAVAATIDVLFFSKDDKFDILSDDAESGHAYVGKDGITTHVDESSDEVDRVNYDEKDRGNGAVANVFGTISGHSDLKAVNGKDWPPIFLFSKSASQGVQVKSGGFIKLSRSVVILPAYSSSLVIAVHLSHCEGGDIQKPIVEGILNFKLQSADRFKKDVVGGHGERIRVRVTWNKSYIEEEAIFEREESDIPREIYPVHWLEIFSVVLYRKDFKPFSFYGRIKVSDCNAWGRTFDKDKNHPQICPGSGALVTLKDTHFHSFEILGYFQTVVDLRDTETGVTISMGTVHWDDIVIVPWLDKRLCSIVRGELGFAAVHYMTFYDGIIANLDMKLGGEHLPVNVYGKIVARYSTYEYSSAYDKKYYQITLFDIEDSESALTLTPGSNLPLLKPYVSLARASSLIVEANLTVSSGDSHLGTELLEASLELNPNLNPDSGSLRRFNCKLCFIDVHVRWSEDLDESQVISRTSPLD